MSKSHIKSIQDEQKSWCGEELTNEFYYKSIDQAALAGLHQSQNISCDKCINQISITLIRGCFYRIEDK